MLGTITFLIIRYKPYTTMSDRYFDKEAAKSPREVINWNFVRLRKQRFYHLIPMDLFYMTQFKIFTLQICVCCHITISLNSLFMLLFVSQVDRVNDQMLRRNSRRVSFTLRKVHLVLAFVAFLLLRTQKSCQLCLFFCQQPLLNPLPNESYYVFLTDIPINFDVT